ncbi:MAG: S8 family peptidase [Actinobacteria bacterium]|nr:S8 family peptidase [Actinomycetota bacterium]
MVDDPLVSTIAPENLDTAAADAKAAALDATHTAVLREEGVSTSRKTQDYTNALNGFSAVLSHDDAVKLASNPRVSMVLPDELRQLTRDDDRSEAGTRPDDLANYLGLTARGAAWKSGLTGEGVVVGVIDSGIWPEHPSFADDGTYPAHEPLDETVGKSCNFGNVAKNANDAPFTCNNKLIGARDMLDTYRAFVGGEPDEFWSARDDDGHGTHTASTAAGNANVQATIFGKKVGVVSGVAPRAQIIAYKALGDLGGFTSDLVAAIDQAVADGVDVINYSVGGGAQLVSGDTISFLFAADAGVFASVSAGNDGPGPETIGGPADAPWVTAVGANSMKRFFQGTAKMNDGPIVKGASITRGTRSLPIVDAANAGTSDLCLAGSLDPAKVTGAIVLCRRGGNGRVAKGAEVARAGGAGMILYNASNDDNLFTDNHFVPTVHVDLRDGEKVKKYIATAKRPRAQITDTATVTTIPYAPSMTIFSSRGPNPTAPDVIKPDITGPGLQILAGASPFPDPGGAPQGELFQAIAGTSMSAPVIAGAYALLKQAHPDWSAAMAKSALMTTANTAVKDNDRVSQAGPFAMGSGELRLGKVNAAGSAFNPGLVYDAGLFEYVGFLCGTDTPITSAAFCARLEAAGIPSDASDLNYPSIAVAELPGSQTVTRTVTSVASTTVTFVPTVVAPAGFTATVSPSSLTLAPGESASYQVVLTNVSAPLGEWRTGSLTWAGGGFSARSPIAVKAVALGAPANVVGAGVDGTAAFDVNFGYSGAYSAAGLGLVPSVPLAGSVLQDVDQTFPSPDDLNGGIVTFPLTFSGTAFARFALSIPGDADLDLFLLDSNNALVAASTNGGTDELIELDHPADGNYTMVVHGWQVPVEPLAFSMDSWTIPTTTGGSLSIVDAPAAAVIGTTGTVTVGWTGLLPGGHYLGAVSHNDGAGEIGLTMIEVNS